MLCYVHYDDLCSIICTVVRGRYCVIQNSCCSTNKTIIIKTIIITVITCMSEHNDKSVRVSRLYQTCIDLVDVYYLRWTNIHQQLAAVVDDKHESPHHSRSTSIYRLFITSDIDSADYGRNRDSVVSAK